MARAFLRCSGRLFWLLSVWMMGWAAEGLAQTPPGSARPASRLAPGLSTAVSQQAVRVSAHDPAAFAAWAAQALPGVSVQQVSRQKPVFALGRVTPAALARLLASPLVEFIDRPARPAHDERLLNQADLTVNAITAVHRRYPQLTGRGLMVSVKENPIDSLDPDFRGRLLSRNPDRALQSAHASIMATLIAGAGNSGPAGQGAAREARLVSHSYTSLLPEPDAELAQLGVSVQNHSYGTGIENYYGLEARDYDRQTQALPTLLHVFSSGNSGLAASPDGPYQGLPAVANLTGQFKMSKNSLSVGATDALGQVAPQSSRGPAYDGRVKPELVALGDAGSSDAAALVSGISLLVQQAYRDGHGGALPPAALVKAALLNSADDVGRAEVDFETGFGQTDALGAVRTMLDNRYQSGQLAQNEEQVIELNVPVGTELLKATLAWTDPEAAPNAMPALINDLDLELLGPAPGARWLPWTLSAFPQPDSLALPARRGADHLNNVEQITLRRPAAGRYRLRVRGFRVVGSAPQAFSLAYELAAPGLTWLTPNFERNVRPGQPTRLRWQWVGGARPAQLDYRPIGQTAWRPLPSKADLETQTMVWEAPDTTTLAQLRCRTGGQEFISDTFAIGRPPRLRVGYACATEALLNWPATPSASGYQVYRLGAKILEPLQFTTDTLLVVSSPAKVGAYYAVEPRLKGRPLERSTSANLAGAGLDCYIRSFLPRQPIADTARLDLSLGTLYQLKSIYLQRLNPKTGFFETIQTVQPVGTSELAFVDPAAAPGPNQYRILGQDQAGRSFYSGTETVQLVRRRELLVFPVPAVAGEVLHVAGEPGHVLSLRLYDSLGRLVREATGGGALNELPTTGLRPGLYVLHAQPEAGPAVTRRVVVL